MWCILNVWDESLQYHLYNFGPNSVCKQCLLCCLICHKPFTVRFFQCQAHKTTQLDLYYFELFISNTYSVTDNPPIECEKDNNCCRLKQILLTMEKHLIDSVVNNYYFTFSQFEANGQHPHSQEQFLCILWWSLECVGGFRGWKNVAALVKPQSTPWIFSPANPNHVTRATAALSNWFVCCLTFTVKLFLSISADSCFAVFAVANFVTCLFVCMSCGC